MPQPLFDPRFRVPPPRLLVVVGCDAFKDTADIGIVEGALLCPAPVLCSELALLSATLVTPLRTAPVANAYVETDAYVLGSNPFHRLADREAWPTIVLFGRGFRQELTDLLIPDLDAAVFRAEPAYFCNPGQQRFGVDLAVFPCAWNCTRFDQEDGRLRRPAPLCAQGL